MNNILNINSRGEFREWLQGNAGSQTECWVPVKRGRPADDNCLYYLDAVEEALCFGWIDSVMKKILYKGGIGAIIDGVQNLMDLTSGEVVNGNDIMDTMVLTMISNKQDDLVDFALTCTDALNQINNVFGQECT
jgi:hypothetical protein